VLGIGSDVEAAPQASLQFDDGNITHNGGDTLTDVKVVNSSGSVEGVSTRDGGELSPGETWNVGFSGEEVSVVHNSTGNVIAKGEV
jgi:hypothetical protein